jgi:hypothetical protein
MTTHLVTFSDKSMSRARELCISSFKRQAESLFVSYSSPELLRDTEFYAANKTLLDQPRGCGYWAWKPYLIHSCLTHEVWEGVKHLHDGDILIYADAGIEFINNVNHIIDRMGHDKPQDDIWLFGNNWEHAHWCKRDVLDVLMPQSAQCPACHKWCGGAAKRMPCEAGYYYHPTIGKQAQASVIFFRVSDYTRKFVAEWLKWCLFEGGRLIDDSPSRVPNHEQFREHRHDQSILTTMAYREGLVLHWWPAQYNRFVPGGPIFTYEKGGYRDDYPPLFHHHRLRNDQWPSVIP